VHLDTQWRWTVQNTIRDFLPATTRGNFALLERHPWFVVSFEGAFRYRLIEEYHPDDLRELRRWVEEGRWRLAGSMLDAPDTNIPSAESLLRHVLHGQRTFRELFGRESLDLFLPDCFGFPWSLPTIAAHCGLRGFSGQKFGNWMAPATIPFEVGFWEGPDGRGVVACLRPEGYGEGLAEDLSRAARFVERIDSLAEATGVPVAMKYVGLGDRGGALDEDSMEWLRRSLEGDGPVRVILSGSDQLVRDLKPWDVERLPRHGGELLLPTHGTGCWTSQAAAKRWNRLCESLADAAERVAVTADWLGALPYPGERLRAERERFLWHQMHDDLTGTSIPEAYRFTWNDQLLARNGLSGTLTDAVAAVASRLDTRGDGLPIVLFNPLGWEREELVEVLLEVPPERLGSVSDATGEALPVQVGRSEDGRSAVLFRTRVPALGFAVVHLSPAEPASAPPELAAEAAGLRLENGLLTARLDGSGRLVSLIDRARAQKAPSGEGEVLTGPLGLELLPDRSARWPAWEIVFDDLARGGERALVEPESIRLLEDGPLRATFEALHRVAGSEVRQRFRLAAGSPVLEIETLVDWCTHGRLLKVSVRTAFAPDEATYDLGCGVVRRGVNRPEKHEVPAQRWADLSSGGAGLAVLAVTTTGWDRPEAGVLRSSLVRSPRVLRKFRHQGGQDLGRHRFLHALHPHAGEWNDGETTRRADELAQPLLAFATVSHDGDLGPTFRLLSVAGDGVAVRALKREEDGRATVLRLQEARGRTVRVDVESATPLASVRPLDGCERPTGETLPAADILPLELGRFELRTLGIRLAPPRTRSPTPASRSLSLPFDRCAVSFHGGPPADLDGNGRSFPGELWPPEVLVGAARATLRSGRSGAANALDCRGQELTWEEDGGRLVLLVAADTDTEVVLLAGQRPVRLEVPGWTGPIGRWKGWRRGLKHHRWGRPGTGFVQRARVAWIAGHRHDRQVADEPYESCYLFAYEIDLDPEDRSLTLPDDPSVHLFAATVVTGAFPRVEAVSPWMTEIDLS
jgi:alpha-mannosidase